jgi:predicted site-specific integrase-resolvase
MCDHFGVEVVIINAREDSTIEEELAGDVIEIVTVFSARLYGSRSPRNRRIMEQLREVGS